MLAPWQGMQVRPRGTRSPLGRRTRNQHRQHTPRLQGGRRSGCPRTLSVHARRSRHLSEHENRLATSAGLGFFPVDTRTYADTCSGPAGWHWLAGQRTEVARSRRQSRVDRNVLQPRHGTQRGKEEGRAFLPSYFLQSIGLPGLSLSPSKGKTHPWACVPMGDEDRGTDVGTRGFRSSGGLGAALSASRESGEGSLEHVGGGKVGRCVANGDGGQGGVGWPLREEPRAFPGGRRLLWAPMA